MINMALKNGGKRYFYKEIDETSRKKLDSLYFGPTDFVYCGDVNYMLQRVFVPTILQMEHMDVYPDDLWIATFPRSGTTWTQEIAWLLNNNMDFEKAKEIDIHDRYSFIEKGHKITKRELQNAPIALRETMEAYRHISTYARPRHIKTHLHLSLLPPQVLETSKVIYVARNPLDTAVSNFHHNQLFKLLDYRGDFKTYWNLFSNGLVPFAPYFPHVKQAWSVRHHHNFLFLFYEDMNRDIDSCVRRIAKFLGKEYTDEQYEKLFEHVKFDNMKENKSVTAKIFSSKHTCNAEAAPFFRKGKVGGWREYFDEEMTQQAEEWIQDNLADTELTFKFKFKFKLFIASYGYILVLQINVCIPSIRIISP